MDLPTYTNIWRIEKRLYKLYDFRLPAPLPINWIAVFAGITVPYIFILILIGLPFNHTLVWLYVLPPGVLTWLTTRPVIENKRLPELLESQVRYLAEPRVWTRLTPLSEKDQIAVSARVWHSHRIPRQQEEEEAAAVRRERRVLVRRQQRVALPSALASADTAKADAVAPNALPVSTAVSVQRAGLAKQTGSARATESGTRVREKSRAIVETRAGTEKTRRPRPVTFRHPGQDHGAGGAVALPSMTPDPESLATGQDGLAPLLPATLSGESFIGVPLPNAFSAANHGQPPAPPLSPLTSAPVSAALPPHATPTAFPVAFAGPAPASPDGLVAPAAPPVPAAPATADTATAGATSAGPVAAPLVADSRAASDAHGGTGESADAIPGQTRAFGAATDAAARPSVPSRARSGGRASRLEVAHSEAGRTASGGFSAHPAASGPAWPASATPVRSAAAPIRPAATEASAGPAAPADRPAAPAGSIAPAAPATSPAPPTPPAPVAPSAPGGSATRDRRPALPASLPAPQAQVPPPAATQPVIKTPAGPVIPARPVGPAGPVVLDGTTVPSGPVVPGGPVAHETPPLPPAAAGEGQPATPRVQARQWPNLGPTSPIAVSAHSSQQISQHPQGLARSTVQPVAPPVIQGSVIQGSTSQGSTSQVKPPQVAGGDAGSAQHGAPTVERALSGPSKDRALSWRGKVKVVTGKPQGPGARDQEALDRARARLPLKQAKRVLVLGCTSGAGQTVTTLMTGHILASLREHPVAAVDLNDGTLARYSAPAAWLEEVLKGQSPQKKTSPRPDGLNPNAKDTQARLDVIASHDPVKDGDELKLAIQLARHYPLTMLDPGAHGLTRLLRVTDQLVIVVPASVEAAGALADTREWLDAHGFGELTSHSVTLVNGVSRRSLPDVEQAESVARGRCRAIVRVPWDDMLPVGVTGPSTLRPQTRVAYTALAGVLVAGMAAAPIRARQ